MIVVVLLTLTVASYHAANPHDGSLLIPAILGILTFIAGLHFLTLDRRYGSAKANAALRADFVRGVETDLASKIAAAVLGGTQVRWEIGSPEVHSIDAEALARARSAAAEGRSMDEICRAIERNYDRWSAPHRQAYQSVIRAAIEHGG